jgi:hypothetical protein
VGYTYVELGVEVYTTHTMTSDTEKQTLMGLAYDIRQSLKDSEYKELVELIMEKEQKKKKYVRITYRKVMMVEEEEIECTKLDYSHPHTTIFEIMPVERDSLEGWDSTKITQEELDDWEQSSFRHPTIAIKDCGREWGTGEFAWCAIKNKKQLWVMEGQEEL